ncbi:MAG TPA: TonB-dependent receptor [Gemmatimonadaceae bacterium]|jgi:outer membrane receptor for ferrienterochelin and colicins|nr:TonB-dependent receptor [Gemmatimonadaceae bacterium]
MTRRSLAGLAGLLAPLAFATAQTGRISGTVTDSAKIAVAGAQIAVVGTPFRGISNDAGRFTITDVPAGSYELRAQRLGARPVTQSGVVVRPNAETTVSFVLARAATQLANVVISASRRAEKVTDAPATVTSLGPELIESSIGNTFASALKEAKGLDYIQTGMTSVAINARGFNSSFNSRFLMVEDGRISVIPESGLPTGSLTPTPKVDLAGMEVLVGPGSALYGPDASNGVLSTRTKDPRDFKGLTLEVTGGNRSYKDVQGRFANVYGDWGYKFSGELQDANDWQNYLNYNAGGTLVAPGTANSVNEANLKVPIDWRAKVRRGSAAIVHYDGDNRLEVNGGMSYTDGIGQTNVGRNQLSGWKYSVLQAKYSTPHWYFNTYREESQSGRSFALNRFAGAQLTPANSSLSADSLRELSDWPSDGRLYAAEAQGNYMVAPLRNTTVVFGAQYRADIVSSKRQWLTDRVTKKDIDNHQTGFYAQTTTPVVNWLDVVLAGRLDYPSAYDQQWSPKAGIILKPVADQAFRVTYNRAFKSPTILQTNFFIPDWTSVISVYGNTDGFIVKDASGNLKATYNPIGPEQNKTWEFGYKGIVAEKLYLDGTYYRSKYDNFTSPLSVISNPFTSAPTYAYPIANPYGMPVNSTGRIVTPAGIAPVVLIYYNLGRATLSGYDIGANYFATSRIELRGTLSTTKLTDMSVPKGFEEATALNAPSTKWTLGATAKDVGPVTASLTFRNVNAYYFRSGVNTGVIPTFGTLDASLSARIPQLPNTLVNVGVSNLYSCTARNVAYKAGTTPANSVIVSEDRGCGLGRQHREMINMPEIGGMLFVGLRVQQ